MGFFRKGFRAPQESRFSTHSTARKRNDDPTTLTLVSHLLCPYVQRAAIALREKDVPFERVVIDLANKPDWFVAISPLGKVPLLRVPRPDGEREPSCSRAT